VEGVFGKFLRGEKRKTNLNYEKLAPRRVSEEESTGVPEERTRISQGGKSVSGSLRGFLFLDTSKARYAKRRGWKESLRDTKKKREGL